MGCHCRIYHSFGRGFVKVLSNFTDGIQLIVDILANFVYMIIKTIGWIKQDTKVSRGVDISSAGVPYLNVMRWGSSNVLDMIVWLRLDMDDRFLVITAVCFVFNFVCFVPTDFLSLKGISQYQSQLLNKFLKYVLKDRLKIYRKNHADLKFECSLYVKYEWSWKRLLMKVF